MAQLALSADLLKEYAKLEKRARNRVSELTGIFRAATESELATHKGVNLKTHTNQADPRARTVRIDDNHRGVVCAINDKKFILHKILPHDVSDAWMARNKFKANVQTGAVEVLDLEAIEAAANEPVIDTGTTPLYAHRKDKDFRQLGIELTLIPALRAFTHEDQLEAIIGILPPGQGEALIELTGDGSPDEIYGRIAGSFTPGSIDEDDLEEALETPAGRSQFHIVTDESDLQDMLAKPLAQWRTFLHHSQQQIAYKPVHNGPVRVTGGAGTGKTVVAMHRAKHLADSLDDRTGKPILFTTFTKNLAESIERDLRELGGVDLLDVVEVINVDKLATRVVREVEGKNPGIIADRELAAMWEDVANELGSDHRAEFLANEWEQVVLAQHCRSREDYFQASRAGRGVRLDRRARAGVWKAIEAFNQRLAADRQGSGRRTFLQLADAAAGYLARREVRPYQHVVVDEAQDLHEAQWRMLRAAVGEAPNDLFIVGDSHQRIYDRRSSLSKVGINIRGRSHKLRINYRTTHEILRWSLQLLGNHSYDDLDEGSDSHDFAGYHSFMHGPEPTLHEATSRRAEIDALVAQVGQWIADGMGEEDIAVAARRGDDLDSVETRLKGAGIGVCQLGPSAPTSGGVRLGTMHRVKGLEFRCVAITGADDERIPQPSALTDKTADEVQHRLDLQREGCLLYVAATRAREDLWVGWSGRPSRFLGTASGN
jgi:superfamily I DNA/RNA helicase